MTLPITRHESAAEMQLACLRSITSRINGFMIRSLNDAEYTCLFMTNGIQAMLGYAAGDFIHNKLRTLASIMEPEDVEGVGRQVEAALLARVPWEVEYRLRHADGRPVWVHDQGAGVFDDAGNLQFLEGFVFSVDLQRLAEAKEQERLRKLGAETGVILDCVDEIMRTLKTLSIISFNARVEASRVGESGRGFAVIADQVGNLADQTSALARNVERRGIAAKQLLKTGQP